MKKQKDHAFRKDMYLLGKDNEGRKMWLEAPSWDCNWYWGFGYVEKYTNNRDPSKAKDIDSHTHIDGLVGANMSKDNGYCNNLFDSKVFSKTTFNEKEGWELSELFERFYTLKKAAAIFHSGSGIASTVANVKNDFMYKEINEKYIPITTARILEILTPKI